MAMNVNTVYTTVLSILNKEQRGYLTPDEFNKIATQVQLEEFEKFFEDYNQYLRMPKTDEEFASRVDHIREEFQVFEKTENASAHAGNVYTQPTTLHRFGSATYTKANGQPSIEIVSSREYREQVLSPLLQPSMNFPIAKYQENKLTVFPPLTSFSSSDVSFNYIRKPEDVRWGYTIGSLGQYIYDNRAYVPTGMALASLNTSTNFTNNGAGITITQTPPSGESSVAYTLTQSNSGSTGCFCFLSPGGGTGAKITMTVTGATSDGTQQVVTISNANTSIVVTDSGSGYVAGAIIQIPINSFITGSPSASIIINIASNNLIGGTGQGSKQFEISDSLQTNLTLGILKYAGVIVKDTQVIQAASGLQQLDEQNSKK